MSRGRPPRPGPGALARAARFAREVVEQAAHDDLLFLASGLTFSLFLAAVPFLLVLLSVAGLVLAPRFRVAPGDVLDRVWEIVPVADPAIRAEVGRHIAGVVESAGSLGLIGGLLFVWFSARFFASVRAALSGVLDVRERRGFVRAVTRDLGLVAIGTVLLSANVALTSLLQGAGTRWLTGLGVAAAPAVRATGALSAYVFVFVMYLLVYKVAAGGRLRWGTSAVAALFAATLFETLKLGFSWYLRTFADLGRISFTLATLIVLGAALYWTAVSFLLGAEVAKVAALRRILRDRLEMFDSA